MVHVGFIATVWNCALHEPLSLVCPCERVGESGSRKSALNVKYFFGSLTAASIDLNGSADCTPCSTVHSSNAEPAFCFEV